MEIVDASAVDGEGIRQQVSEATLVNQIRSRLAALAPYGGSRPGGPGWRQALERVMEALEHLNRSTERDFLAVGQKLMEFRAAARQASSGMAALSELISSQSGEAACQGLTRMLEHTRAMDQGMAATGAALESVRDLSGRVQHAFSGLSNRVMVFRTLCTLTRIETARLGAAGLDFGHLAEEVQPLSEQIQTSGAGVLQSAAVLGQEVQSALRDGANLRASELKDLHAISASVLHNLQCFEDRRERAREASNQQAARYSAVTEAIDDLVQSVQFHDITRQQVEHVTQALRALLSGMHHRRGQPPPEAAAVLALQASQLSSAAQVFAASVDRIEADLAGIAARVEEMAAASRVLLCDSGDDQNVFFLEMERSFTSILNGGKACRDTEARIGATAAHLKETINQMRGAVTGIHATEIQVQRIALNATIRATQLEAAGEALGVVAEVMQRLAIESNQNTESVAALLDAMRNAAGRIAGPGEDTALGEPGIFEQMQAAVLELHSSSGRSCGRLNEIVSLGARLAQDVGALRSSFTAGRLFEQVTRHALEELERISTQTGQMHSPAREVSPVAHLANLAGQYTMQRERDVHRAVADGAVVPGPANPVQAAAGGGDFGDNVELF
ncbi:MAG TPA: hypothetical protein VMB25_16665 [Bryobacteraceae bacterium]|nr:hypothetical protein [Bryobacteraceae bacterium]